jgi:cytochrome c556
MGISAKLGIVAIVAAVAGTAFFSADSIQAAMGGAEAIKARKAAMKSLSADMKVIRAFVKDGKGTAADVEKKAAAIAATAKQIPALFPKGTGRPDVSDKETRAVAKIWTDWPGFEAASTALVTEAGKLAEIAKAGDTKMIADQAGALGKVGCGGCHKPYRGAKAK